MRPFTFQKAESLPKTLSGKKASAQYIAGGTNQLDLMKKHISQPEVLVDITSILSDKIEIEKKGVSIGAMVRNSAVTMDKNILENFPLLAKAILAGASPQIRNMATTSGNILQRTRCPYFYDVTAPCNKRNPGSGCSAIKGENRMSAIVGHSEQCVAVHPSDMSVALAALDAIVEIIDKDQKKKSIPFKDFHRLPGDTPHLDNNLPGGALIQSIEIPQNAFSKNCAYLKIRDRDSYAFALVSVAAALELSGGKIRAARLASGGVAHKPWRWYEAEKFLKGKEATLANFEEAAEIAVRDVKPLSGNGYKVSMLKGAIMTALNECVN
jgi:xanthine dehydrogenase YagS FAD-binding subunit